MFISFNIIFIILIILGIGVYVAGSICLLFEMDEITEFISMPMKIFADIVTAPALVIYTMIYTIFLLIYSIYNGISYIVSRLND